MGVLHRINELTDRTPGKKPKNYIPYKNIIPLAELIAEVEQVGVKSKKVTGIYEKLLESAGSEFRILLDIPIKELEKIGGREIAGAIDKARKGKVKIEPGYDGKFGKISLIQGSAR